MKKIMIAVAAVALATCAQAYNVTWGLFDTGEGNTFVDWAGNTIEDGAAGANVSAYFYALADAGSAITFSDNAIKISDDGAKLVQSSDWLSMGWGNAMDGAIDSAVSTLGNEFQYFQMVLTDGDINALAEGDHVYIMDPTMVQGTDLTIGGTNWEYDATDINSSISKGGWDTVAAPEPTSGLLLLIGVAGLALKRRRA